MKFKRAGNKTNSCIVFSTLMYMTVKQFLVVVQWLAESALANEVLSSTSFDEFFMFLVNRLNQLGHCAEKLLL